MNAAVQAWTVDNERWAGARPRLSVLIPYLNYDPRALLSALDREAAALAGAVEIVLLDDGGADDAMAGEIAQAVATLALPARSLRLVANEGRSRGRNRLAANARGRHLLFLDSDMLPDTADFLARWIALIDGGDPAVTFGGFSMDQTPVRREHALHRRLAGRSDCAPASLRRLHPEKYVFTSNLLVRRDVFDAEAFDEGFRGWGWEDVEWGIRTSGRFPITHADNTATHLGLDRAEVIAMKYEQSAANFARVSRTHPAVVRTYPSHKAARLLKRLPLRRLWRPALKGVALAPVVPVGVRAFSMRLYRAALCADAI
jgi:glycosyltransferase involved in cell wall biosynthesis